MIKRFLSTAIIVVMAVAAMAQTNIRYVCNNSDSVKNIQTGAFIGCHVPGKYENDGTSWAKAKDNIQDAINDLVNNNLEGEVWVASGTYYPTETTESTGGSTLYMSFKIPKGITVRGGFKGMLAKNAIGSEDNKTLGSDSIAFAGENSNKPYDATSNPRGRVKVTNSTSSVGYYYPYQAVLSGNISANHKAPTFTWNSAQHKYNTEFYGNSYHVVTFATKGFDENGRANPLGTTAEIVAANGELAKLEGVMVKNGYAYNSSTEGHPHNAYGGGVYMVPGASLEDVAVENCEASRDGGGVYLDGGGRCCHVYVADCQALGSSLTTGYGGGICVDENLQIFPPMVLRSAMINCVARYGGGLANRVNHTTTKITAGGKTYDMRYNQGFSALVISGCTALTEGGGVYALNGGSFTQCTIARNACYGSGITVNGMKTGQSAGFYARNNVVLANSILWGGAINGDEAKAAQYASSRSTTSDKAEIYYVAMNNAGRADFTGVKATNTIKLSRYNTATAESEAGATSNSEEGYVDFLHPLSAAGYSDNAAAMHFKAYESGSDTYNGISYKVQYTSACTNAGVPTGDLDTEKKTPDQKGKTADVFGDLFSSNPTLGAYTSYEISMSPDVEYTTGTTTYATSGNTYKVAYAHVFVDPNTQSEYTTNVGSAWDKPVKKLADALNKIGEVASDRLPQIEQYGYTITKIIVHVKEGTTTVQGADATGSIRASSLVIPDVTVTRADGSKFTIPLEILGGYKSSIVDDLNQAQTSSTFTARHQLQSENRNPVLYHSIVTGYVMDDYAYTTPHIFKIDNIKGQVTIDGLQVRYANAWSTTLDNTVTTGGAFTITNSTNVTLKNVLIAHCQASNGPAIYETGNSNVSLENCIIHNNTINVAGVSGGNFEVGGIIYTDATSHITLNHCDVLRNVGYAFYNDGKVTMDNSICYANMKVALDDTNGHASQAMKTFAGTGTVTSLYGTYNLFDTGSASDAKATSIGYATQEFTFVSGTNNHYPSFINPTKNSGVSEGGDATYYGRSTSFEPQNTNNGVNAGYCSGDHLTWGTDFSANTLRDFGGLPDIGAVESHVSEKSEMGDIANPDGQPTYGILYYVKDYGNTTEGGDGMSWKNAINGNAYYSESTGAFLGSSTSGEVTYWTSEATYTYSEGTATTDPSSYYSTTSSSDPTYVKIKNPGYGTYLKYNTSSKAFEQVSTFAEADNFILVSGMYIYDATAKVYLGYTTSGSGSSANCSINIESSQSSAWTINTGGQIYISSKSNNSSNYYYYALQATSNSSGLSFSSSSKNSVPTAADANTWNYVSVTKTATGSTELVQKTETVTDGINGLQYAVNAASHKYSEDNVGREVWVAAGTYAKDPETKDGYYFSVEKIIKTATTTQGRGPNAQSTTTYTYTDADESCFIIRDGVDVYGAFPAVGNPCKNQREALLSQYVKKRADKSTLNEADYETILQPTSTIAVGKVSRVLGQPYAYNPNNSPASTYNGAKWDGFTIRNGFIDASKILVSSSNGGAGATVYEKVTLKNCVVTNNINFAPNGSMSHEHGYRGGGVVVRGGTVEECYIINNEMYDTSSSTSTTSSTEKSGVAYGGGLYFNYGTIYNCVVAKNSITAQYADGAGFFIDGNVNCYNNTVVYNEANGTTRASGGICVWSSNGSASNLQIFNTICEANTGLKGQVIGTKDISIALYGGITLTKCFSETNTNLTGSNTSGSSAITFKDCVASTDYASIFSDISQTSSFELMDLRLKSGSPAINVGLDTPTLEDGTTVDLSTYTDMDYEDRIQDCTIDIGAYEYNGAYDITPTLSSDGKEAYFYVTQNGRGTASAQNPTNAACYLKLQKVIDAAGRYKYNHSGVRCIVKLAGDADNTGFQYVPCRTTDQTGTDQDVRIWSIIVPRGVEVWGGYTDAYTDETTNGFTADRDIINHPTYFTGEYVNKDENSTAFAYHVVEFSNNVYDGNGVAYKEGDETKIANNQDASTTGTLLTLDAATFGRGIVDGIFIENGQADVNTTTKSNTNKYGGAALVNEYGHVRNCIVRNNTGDYGGGLAIAKGGLVSGCLVDQNTAKKNGGGVYVLTDEENTNIGVTSKDIPHIYTSTIVNNTATVQGGGIHFDNSEDGKDAVRVNSSVIWQNHCSDMANVAGTYAPEKATTDKTSAEEYYPIAYTAIQNLRASGTNNISIASENKGGARFWQNYVKSGDTYTTQTDDTKLASETDFNEFGLYKLTNISALLRVGMPVTTYNSLVKSAGLASADFAAVARDAKASTTDVRTYIDMGARALTKKITDKELMLRLFVAQAEDVDADAETNFAQLTGDSGSDQEYYSQQGSSFAYPFHNLQDALDYIYLKRGAILGSNTTGVNDPTDNANLLPFEICVAKGTYYPTEDLMGNYGQSFSNTFAIPEGVNIYGGFDATELGTDDDDNKIFYGRYNKAKSTTASELPVNYSNESTSDKTPTYIINNITPVSGTANDTITHDKNSANDNAVLAGYTIREANTDHILLNRTHEDVNGNSIIEPWEFRNQTILSGKSVGEDASGVFHVITFVPDQNVVGVLPPKAVDFSDDYDDATETNQKYMNHEHGQYSILNGLIITGGSAKNYFMDANMEELSKYNYYHGGGLLADGNRYNNSYNTDEACKYETYTAYNSAKGTSLTKEEWEALCNADYKHSGVTNAVAYRDEIVTINQCKFLDNEAGYGGAMSINNTVDVYNSSFEENLAEYYVDNNVPKDGSPITVKYPGQGGAVFSTHQFAAYNTVFANNEAQSSVYTLDGVKCPSYRNPDESKLSNVNLGVGGAIYSGIHGQFHLINCDLVRNKANIFPAVATKNPNTYTTAEQASCSINDYNQFLNTVVWGNELNPTMKSKFKDNAAYLFAGQLICNYGSPNRDKTNGFAADFSSTGGMPTKQSDLDDATKFAETAWFSAYEDGRGITANNKVDMRDAQFRPYLHATAQIKSNRGADGENCNIEIDTENSTLEGPNFSNPSKSAGVDGYDEGSDWSPARLNNLTDNGSGKIYQHIIKNADETYVCEFPNYTKAATYDSQYTYGTYDASRISGSYAYSNETANDYVTSGAYTTTRYMIATNYANTVPLGDDFYMKSLNGTTEQQMLYRISYDPNPTHNATYIDIGVYEYPHTPLKVTTEGDEVDILWVSSAEKPDNGLPEGSAWSQPTSDLQRAIETLLSSRNGHRKEIRLMDGTYSPTYTIEGNLAFYFDTKYINSSVVLPDKGDGYGVKSFTIKGGYSKDLNEQYDIDEYPAIIRQKKQTESGTNNWNHLFYIKDATQRNGYASGYEASNGYGWWTTTDDQTKKPAPTTIPIQIDGVKFVNNQANAGVDGAAIYYQNQTFDENCVQFDEDGVILTSGTSLDGYYTDAACTTAASGKANGTTKYYKKISYRATAPTSAYVSLMDENGDKVVDTTKGTISYTDANHTAKAATGVETQYKGYYYKSVTKDNPYKFILSRSTVMNSGAISNAAVNSAAYIGKYGGEALVYNSVFHSNRGDALQAYATKTINNTFALNTGMMKLMNLTGNSTYDAAHSYTSKIYNSVFWKNNNGGSGTTYGSQFNLVADASTTYDGSVSDGKVSKLTTSIQSNAYTGGNEDAIEYELKSGETTNTIIGNNYNVGLSSSNTDAVYGPNFVNPNDSYTGTADSIIEARDFMLQPSLRLLNRGDNNTVHSAKTGLYSTGDLTATTPVFGDIYDYAWVTSTNTDAGSEPRIIVAKDGVIDLGAYEYQSKQNRVLYVDPNKLASGTGLSWASPFGYGNIQAAIDACAVYYKNEHKQTYVFVKANSGTNLGQHSGETLTMRNGVAVYGSVVSDYLEDCPKKVESTGDYTYTDAELATYVKDIKVYHRNGIISPTEGHTRILGINTNGTAFDNTDMSVIDGFDVTAQTDASSDDMVEVTEPVININPKKSDTEYATGGLKMVLHNIAVHGNDFSGGNQTDKTSATRNNLININNCLLYEALVYNNKVADGASVLNLDGFENQAGADNKNYGYAASVTVEGKTTGADGSVCLNNTQTSDDPVAGNTTASHVYNSITNYSGDAATWKTLSGYCYKQSHQGSNYQLTEKSKYIDAITVDKTDQSSVLGDMPTNFSQFIHYWPTISGTTWTQADRDVLGNFRLQTLGTVAGGKYDGNDYSSDGTTAYAPKLDRGACETWDVQQSTLNLFPDFPHDGSVEYIRAGKSLIIDPIITGVVNSAHEPGFCLLEMGANLYGNGRRVQIPYVAVESYIPAGYVKKGSSFVMSSPFRMNYNTTVELDSLNAVYGNNTSVQGIGTVKYDVDGGLQYDRTDANFYTYDGAGRSASDYEFNTGVTSSSDCWKSTTGDIAAARGVLMVYNSDVKNQITYRVTSKGVNYEDDVYKEEVNFLDNHVFQSVPLYKYDDSESTKGAADFTDMNDQGWNCIGLPYLVSNYHPYYKATATYNPGASKPVEVSIKKPGEDGYSTLSDAYYAMNKPKTMWLYYNGKENDDGDRAAIDGTKVDGDGGFYSVNSWEAATSADELKTSATNPWHVTSLTSQRIYMGEGFFVQNQKFSDNDTLKFYIPVAPTLPIVAKSGSKQNFYEYNTRYYYSGEMTAMEEVGISRVYGIKVINHTLYVDNLEGGENIRIYTSAGQLMKSDEAPQDRYSTDVEPGVLIISVNGVTKKVYVK